MRVLPLVASTFLFLSGDVRATELYKPLTSLPHPGEFFFKLSEMRAKRPVNLTCAQAFMWPAPREEPPVKVGWEQFKGAVPGNDFAINLFSASSYLMRAPLNPKADAVIRYRTEEARASLLSWAAADAFNRFQKNSGAHWWAVYQAFPAILLMYSVLDDLGRLNSEEKTLVHDWMASLVSRTRIGLDMQGMEGLPNNENKNNKNARRNLAALLWAIEENDAGKFNRAVEAGYVRFLRNMRVDGSLPDANRGNWALWYTSFHIGAAMFIAEAAAHQGADLYGLEIGGRSIHAAVKFLLDADEDNKLVAKYAKANAGIDNARFTGIQDQGWKNNGQYGMSTGGWIDLYIARFPDSENVPRLKRIRERMHGPVLDWSFGNVACFWGAN